MKILAFLSEQYFKKNDTYVSKTTSAKFIQDCFGEHNVTVVSQISTGELSSGSSCVSSDKFIKAPYFSTIKDFVIKSLKQPKYLLEYIDFCNNIIESHPQHVFWARNPSLGSLIFSLCVIRKKRKLFNHMCANAINGWKNSKYSTFDKLLGYLFSRILKLMIWMVAKNKNSINFCTGDELYKMCKKYNDNSFQFVDLMIENERLDYENCFNKQKEFNFTFIGRVQEDKGVYDLVTEFTKLSKDGVFLNVIGGGDLDKLKQLISLPNINVTGQLPHSELNKYLQKTNVIIVPSKNSYEGFPRVIMEAWAYGIPVIVCDVGGVKAFVRNDVNGILIKDTTHLGEAMRKLLNDETYYKLLVSGAIKSSKISSKLYWIDSVKEILKVNYEK